jgi:hypothetical protein
MVHQLFRTFIIVEVEKDATEAVFFWMKGSRFNVAIDPSDDFINKYLAGNEGIVIIKPLISEAPLQKENGITLPSLEKVLVDITCDKSIFNAAQGAELRNIFTGAFQKYTIFSDRLLRYASRRGKRDEMIQYLKKIQIYGNNKNLLPDYSLW